MPAALSVTAGLMRQQNGGRKLSIAPWADSTLLHFNALNQARPKESRLGNSRKSADSLVKSEYSLSPATSFLSTIGPTIEAAISDSPFSSLESRLRAKIYNKLDTKTKLRLLRLDHTTHRLLLLGGHGIFGTVDLSPWKKELTNELLGYITNLLANADIHKLVLHGCWQVNDAGLVIVAQNIPAIEHLDLNSAWDITDTGIASVAANCKRILSLDLSNCRKISSAGMLMVLEAASTLQNVQLSYCKSLNDDMMLHKTWASLLKANFQRCTGIFDKGFAHWVTIQTTLSQPFAMLDLCLSDCTYLTDESIVAIASTCPSLQNLNLSFCCSLSEQSMAILAKQCRSLECLDASYCGNAITDYSLDLLSSLPRLKILSIRGCVQATVSGLESFPSDTNINFSQCRGIPSDYKRV